MNLVRGLLTAGLLPLVCLGYANAQQQDSLNSIRTFIKVCNSYKQLPLQLEASIERSVNFATGKEDTGIVQATFCMQEDASYVRFGDLEQLVEDSLMLLVNGTLRRMLLYATHQSVQGQLNRYLGMHLADASVIKLAGLYAVWPLRTENNTTGMELKSRSCLFNTHLPKDEIRLLYDPVNNEPARIVQLRRSLIMVDSLTYDSCLTDPAFEDRVIKTAGSDYFIVKEQSTTFLFTNISHTTGMKLPARLADRITAEGGGKYIPVKPFDNFLLTQNF
jgi:hypothetical protein